MRLEKINIFGSKGQRRAQSVASHTREEGSHLLRKPQGQAEADAAPLKDFGW
jgi:hypothetical protein